jgi:hypothetical protein
MKYKEHLKEYEDSPVNNPFYHLDTKISIQDVIQIYKEHHQREDGNYRCIELLISIYNIKEIFTDKDYESRNYTKFLDNLSLEDRVLIYDNFIDTIDPYESMKLKETGYSKLLDYMSLESSVFPMISKGLENKTLDEKIAYVEDNYSHIPEYITDYYFYYMNDKYNKGNLKVEVKESNSFK